MENQMKLFVKGLTIIGILLLISSCGRESSAFSVILGNTAYNRGLFQKAILHYFAAEEQADEGKDVASYNLANVYYALGEGEAALRSWEEAEDLTSNSEVMFRAAFNRGVFHYSRGYYSDAYLLFRQALKINPRDIDAKINLEESLSRISLVPTRRGSLSIEQSNDGENKVNQQLLDYVRRKEAGAWSDKQDNAEDSSLGW